MNIGNNLSLFVSKDLPSEIYLGEIEITFDITEKFPGIDVSKISITSGAVIDSQGIVSGYEQGVPIVYTYDCGTSKNRSLKLQVTLNIS